jgi:D-alanyl-D-alanine carboxypeptidase
MFIKYIKASLLAFFCIKPILVRGATYAHVIMDPLSGKCLESVNSERLVYPASLAKMMTLLILFEQLKLGKISLKTSFRVSKKATYCLPSKLWVRAGDRLSVSDCILALSTRSCNDVAAVVAENLAGSTERFVTIMNKKAKALKLKKTRFRNPSGWHHPGQMTCAKDMGLLMRALWLQCSKYAHFLGQKHFQFRGKTYTSTNKLLGKVQGLCMGKTGFTTPSGYNLSTLTARYRKPVIVVVMGAGSKHTRDKITSNLIEKFYAQNTVVRRKKRLKTLCAR